MEHERAKGDRSSNAPERVSVDPTLLVIVGAGSTPIHDLNLRAGLPPHSTARRLAQRRVVSLQRTRGNSYVQRLIAPARPDGTLQREPATPDGLRSARFQALPIFQAVLGGGQLLRAGTCNGPTTSAIQGALADLGYDLGTIDGLWGSRTQAAIVAFQRDHSLARDGVIGPLTLRQLDQADATGAGGEGSGGPTGGGPDAGGTGGGGAGGPTGETVTGTGEHAGPTDATVFGELLGLTGGADQELMARLARALGVPAAVIGASQPPVELALPLAGALETSGAPGQDGQPRAPLSPDQANASAPVDLNQTIAWLGQLSTMIQAAAATGGVAPDVAQLAQIRIDAITRFFQSQASLPVDQQVSGQRMAIVATALSQIGAARANEAGDPDPTDPQGRRFRKGHEALLDYFTTAFGGSLDENQRLNVTYHGTKLQSWCGIFGLWAYKKNGVAAGVTWQTGALLANPPHAGMRSVAARLVDLKTNPVKPGDIGIIAEKQHHFMVTAVNGDSLDTIEGNSNSAGDPTGGQVSPGRRSISGTFSAGFGFQRPVDLP